MPGKWTKGDYESPTHKAMREARERRRAKEAEEAKTSDVVFLRQELMKVMITDPDRARRRKAAEALKRLNAGAPVKPVGNGVRFKHKRSSE